VATSQGWAQVQSAPGSQNPGKDSDAQGGGSSGRFAIAEEIASSPIEVGETSGLTGRKSYDREASRIAIQVGRYARAKQFQRMIANSAFQTSSLI